MKAKYVKDLQEGDRVNEMFSIRFKKPMVPYKGRSGSWFEFRVGDRSGEMALKFWGSKNEEATKAVYDSVSGGDVILVNAVMKKFNDLLEISVNPTEGDTIRKAIDFDMGDFVATTPMDINAMWDTLMDLEECVEDKHLRPLLDSFFLDKATASSFKSCPASVTHHCNYLGGLLEHTLKVTRIAFSLCDIYPELDRELVITGALLHDIGKLREYEVRTNINASDEGRLVGHIVIGAEMVRQAIRKIPDFPPELEWKLVHIILSSHGQYDYGSPKLPMIPEAVVISQADATEAKLDDIIYVKNSANTEDAWTYDKNVGSVYLR